MKWNGYNYFEPESKQPKNWVSFCVYALSGLALAKESPQAFPKSFHFKKVRDQSSRTLMVYCGY
jgi:hypothetical protein